MGLLFRLIYHGKKADCMDRLKDKVVILSGGNSGIGACAAKLFAAEGAKVVISARRVEALDAVAEEIRQAGGEVLAIPCDISKPEQCAAVVAKTVETFGTVDVLVNNAGVLDSGLDAIEKISDETIDRLVDTNTKGTLYLTREAAKVLMAKKSGSIVNVASKAAIIGLTKNIAMRGASVNVRCNAVCPGTVVTPMTAGLNPANLDPDMMGAMAKHADLTLPVCQPQDVANLLLFLASDESKAVTGQVLVIDYGANL